MKLVGLISGGKDSIFNLHQCISAGHEIIALANIEPAAKEEINSYMYQTVGFNALSVLATALGLPIYRQKTNGKAVCKKKNYSETPEDEVEDLFSLLKKVKKEVQIEGVAVGAIASDYQRTRVENVCRRLNLQCFAYLWRRNEEELLQEMIDSEIDAVLIKVASMGLLPEVHLGMRIKDIKPYLLDLNKKFGVSICGEGGEYETLTVDCPLFNRTISLTDFEKIIVSNDAFAPVAYLNVKNVTLDAKMESSTSEIKISSSVLPNMLNVKNPYDYIEDCVDKVTFSLFPQRILNASSEDLPFPFSSSNESSKLHIREYWKSPSFTPVQQSSSLGLRQSGTSKVSLIPDKSNCDLNYSSGWCCIGNIYGSAVEDVFSILTKQLERMKYECTDIVFINLYIKNMKDFEEINKFYASKMPKSLPPARSCVETILPADTNIVMSVVAHKQVSRSQAVLTNSQVERDTMHVESISHWAPATIGPYSQCVKVGNFYYLAGQIPLIPGSMEILNKPIYHQCKLTLRHVQRIMEAMNKDLNYGNVLLAICYATSEEIVQCVNSLWSHITGCEKALVTGVVVTALPQEAQFEWEVIAFDGGKLEYSESEETVDNYKVEMKRYSCADPLASAIVVRVSNQKIKNTKSSKSLTIVTEDGIKEVLTTCLSYFNTDLKNSGPPLYTLKVFYKVGDFSTLTVLNKLVKSSGLKVVVTGIPVMACENPKYFLTVTGVCH